MFSNSDPKPLPKPKKTFGYDYWTKVRKKSAEKKKMKLQPIQDRDNKFYEFLWKKREHRCVECGNELMEHKKHNFHHKLPKRSGAGGMPYFRYDERNVEILCWSCHQKCESHISYPKMKVFNNFEKDKKMLLAEVGVDYVSNYGLAIQK